MPELTDTLYLSISIFAFIGMVLAIRLLINLRKHYSYVEEFGSAIGFLRSDKFLQYIQVLSISVLLWLASVLSTIGVSMQESGPIVTKIFELLSIVCFIVGCYTALEVIGKYESKPKLR